MRYHVLAVDYDGTLARFGKVDEPTIDALKNCKLSSRKIILVTGRELDALIKIFPEYEIFDRVVAENGALVYNPASREEKLLGERPPENFISELLQKKVAPISVGRVIVATWEPHHTIVLEAIRNAGIEYQVIFNKGAVMVLPPGINKAKGLEAALAQLKISMHNVVAIGDAENDNAMLKAAECSAAVANALDSIKQEATFVTSNDRGDGVAELIGMLLKDDLVGMEDRLVHSRLVMGKIKGGNDFILHSFQKGILVAGTSGGGKSTLTTAFMEALTETAHQFCIIDPEGDYLDFPHTVVAGNSDHEPVLDEVMTLLDNPSQNVIVCLLAVPLDKRPHFFNNFIVRLSELRSKTGRPHWFIVDEAHHLLPSETEDSFFHIPDNFKNFMLITVTPKKVNRSIMKYVGSVLVIGDEPQLALQEFAEAHKNALGFDVYPLPRGQAWFWRLGQEQPTILHTRKPTHIMRRHIKKYATGNMLYNEFFFKGPENKLNLKATNVITFIQMAEGVDDETWLFHLKEHAYSSWFEKALHDDELASLAGEVEETEGDAAKSKSKILELVKERYTL